MSINIIDARNALRALTSQDVTDDDVLGAAGDRCER
jgi:hypothetical protein